MPERFKVLAKHIDKTKANVRRLDQCLDQSVVELKGNSAAEAYDTTEVSAGFIKGVVQSEFLSPPSMTLPFLNGRFATRFQRIWGIFWLWIDMPQVKLY